MVKAPAEIQPRITVVTVVRNGEKYIEHTIQSIIGQTYSNIEYVIIDGNSTDGTVDIIKKYADKIDYWVSEPDKGIYDAMNKGVRAANGDWLLFINADDYLAEPNAIEEASKHLSASKNKIVYGNVIYVHPSGEEILYGPKWDAVKYRFRNVAMYLAHQATFHAKALFQDKQFDASFKIAGDYDFLLRHLKDHEADYIPVTVAKMRVGGLSYSVSKFALLSDTRKAQRKNGMYKVFPKPAWIISAAKLIIVDRIIKTFGIDFKNKIKKLFKSK